MNQQKDERYFGMISCVKFNCSFYFDDLKFIIFYLWDSFVEILMDKDALTCISIFDK